MRSHMYDVSFATYAKSVHKNMCESAARFTSGMHRSEHKQSLERKTH
jgi:hypothetical protein